MPGLCGAIKRMYVITYIICNNMQGGKKHPMPSPPEGRYWDVVDLPNFGREANTFAEHLVRRYDSLAAYTIFSQVLAPESGSVVAKSSCCAQRQDKAHC